MANKYNARKVTQDGYTFDSQAEARRYNELVLLHRAQEIALLEVHPRFKIINDFDWRGQWIAPTYYEGDFKYFDFAKDKTIIEDVKGVETAVFKLKAKLFKQRYPEYEFLIVRA